MSCTTLLVGKKASNDGSAMIARTDDGHFDVKKAIVVRPEDQPKIYKSVISHLEIELPDDPLRYTACPSVDPSHGIWAATGINAANVGMTATETISTNPRVLAADPFVRYQKAEKEGEEDRPGGIGEEDIVVLVLPYVRSAREGVKRLGALLEKYGTYESNGIAFCDENEVWWLETIGGHHYIASKIPDEVCVLAPNQFGMDRFDLSDALGKQKDFICSADMEQFISDNHLDLNNHGIFNPRRIFGSNSDHDHIYNTPRAWFMGRYLSPHSYRWEGENARFTPESDDIPWCLVPERKVTVDDVIYLLSSHYQGTPYDPYINRDTGKRGMYRSIGINRTGVTSICQIRQDAPKPLKGVEWICFGSTTFSAFVPVYSNVDALPAYLSEVSKDVSSENFYWASRLIDALCDRAYYTAIRTCVRYRFAVQTEGLRIIAEYDKKMKEQNDYSLCAEANGEICETLKKLTVDTLGEVLLEASKLMKNGYDLADN